MTLLRSLSTRIAVPAGFFVLLSVAGLSAVLIRAQREQMLAEVIHGSESIAETLRLSIDHDMRVNYREGVREVLRAVGTQEGIESVRVLNKDGKVSYSSRTSEVGATVDMTSEACVSCHANGLPASSLNPEDRSRVYTDSLGQSFLGTIYVIRNEEGCQGAGCHVAPSRQSVLGVLDVAVSLAPAEARLASATRQAIFISLAAAIFMTGALMLFVRAGVRRPIDRIVVATRQAAGGDPSVPVPRGAAHEFKVLATSVNAMIEGLASSRAEAEAWSGTLEERLHDQALELRDAQFQIAQAEKLSSVGLVAAGIAHELNSPLMAILTFTHLVRDAVAGNDQVSDDLRMIESEANRCAAIIRQLLDFSRKQTRDPEVESCSIPAVLDDAVELLKVELQNADVVVQRDVARDLPTVDANRVQLMQVFVNLMMNAIHAMSGGGEIKIGAGVALRSDYASAGLPPHPGAEVVRITVQDTGTGIAREDLRHVFDPFFTTKPVGQGSGLGLSVSVGLIGRHRGTILVDSDGKSGSEFTVLLPVPHATESMVA